MSDRDAVDARAEATRALEQLGEVWARCPPPSSSAVLFPRCALPLRNLSSFWRRIAPFSPPGFEPQAEAELERLRPALAASAPRSDLAAAKMAARTAEESAAAHFKEVEVRGAAPPPPATRPLLAPRPAGAPAIARTFRRSARAPRPTRAAARQVMSVRLSSAHEEAAAAREEAEAMRVQLLRCAAPPAGGRPGARPVLDSAAEGEGGGECTVGTWVGATVGGVGGTRPRSRHKAITRALRARGGRRARGGEGKIQDRGR